MFGRATITLGIGPHSSYHVHRNYYDYFFVGGRALPGCGSD